MAVSRKDVAALNGEPTPDASPDVPAGEAPDAAEAKPFISEGMRHDLEFYGYVTDPLTGKKITKDE